MTKMLHAVFNGDVLCFEEPLELKPNTHVRIKLETITMTHNKKCSFFQTARSLKLKGPADWSASLDDYLYGDKKQ